MIDAKPGNTDRELGADLTMYLTRPALPEWLRRSSEAVAVPRRQLANAADAPIQAPAVALQMPRTPDPSQVDAVRQQSLYEACLIGGAGASRVIESWLLGGISLEDAYLNGITPVARRLGRDWCDDNLDFASVTLGAMRLQQLLGEWGPAFVAQERRPETGRNALLLPEFGSQHTLGVMMLGDFFARAGWQVCTPLADGPQEPLRLLSSDWIDLLGLSVSTDRALPALRQWIGSARAASANPRLVVLVGGPMAALHRNLAAELGADDCTSTASEAVALASKRLPALTAARTR